MREPLNVVRQRLLKGMTDYMAIAGGYTQSHIDQCKVIIDRYLSEVGSQAKMSQDQIRDAVQRSVIDLNRLNEEAGEGLIETDQREDLCELILHAAVNAGLDTDEDVTEEWREW